MTLRLSEFGASVERSCPSTRANCTCDLRERHRIIITQIIIAHSLGVSKRRVARKVPAPKRRRWLPAIMAAKYGHGTSSLEMSKDGEKRIMIVRSALCAMCLAGLVGGVAQAGTNDILIGIDNKITYGPEGQINGAPGNDAVLVVDIS